MNRRTGKLVAGIALMVSFLAVLIAIFMPLIDGQNALNYLDNLYNSISKASAYYIPDLQEEVHATPTEQVSLTLDLGDEQLAARAATLLDATGCQVVVNGAQIEVEGSLGAILEASLADADDLYHNRVEALASRYGMDGQAALHAWWKVIVAMEKELTRQRKFAAADLARTVNGKAVETAYNYYRIEPQPIGERWLVVLLSLVFYVVYTVWYGYAVMFLFEGLGLKLGH